MELIKKVLAIILVLSLCFAFNHGFLLDYYNDSSMYGSFEKKKERAETIGTEKIVIIGGSSSNLGFNSEYFEQLSGKPAVNLAVTAGVPLKVYMRAAERYAKPGDVVIMPLEYTYYEKDFNEISESYVDMVCVDPYLKCEESLIDNIEYWNVRFLRSFTRLKDCILFALRKLTGNENVIYIADSVDEYGDFCLHKDGVPTYESVVIANGFQYNSQILNQIKSFIENMEKKGISVYLSYPCVDKNAIVNSEQYFTEVQQVVEEYIPKENILGTPHIFGFEPDFFFDTPYHPQYKNREIYTEKLFLCYKESAE